MWFQKTAGAVVAEGANPAGLAAAARRWLAGPCADAGTKRSAFSANMDILSRVSAAVAALAGQQVSGLDRDF